MESITAGVACSAALALSYYIGYDRAPSIFISLLAGASRLLADKAIAGFTVNEEKISGLVGRNPILVTALNPVIGYEMGAKIAKMAYAEGRTLREVALEMTELTSDELDRLLDPRQLTEGGIQEA